MREIERMIKDIEREVAYTQHEIGKHHLDARVIDAMRKVPRHRFVPEETRSYAYDNHAASIGYGQTISQPYIVALMTDLLAPQKDHVILEIGCGSGYQAAILSLLVKQVYSVEIVKELGMQAQQRLQRLGYRNIAVRIGDGYAGWQEHAPYDGIIVTAAAPHIPQPLLQQLKPGGRLVIPVGLPYMYQELLVIEKQTEDAMSTKSVLGVAFVPLTGEHVEHVSSPG